MGVVYLAQHLRLKQRRALKLLPQEFAEDANFRARFERESELAASLEHPAIVPIHDAGEVDGILYIAMRYVPGSDLKEIITSEGSLPPDRVIALLEQISDALDTAHETGLVHRDVKPQNTLVSPARSARDREHAYLTDFGLTKRYDSKTGLTSAGMMVGTADYMSPEQLRSQDVDARSDVYALGCMFYECLVGKVPFDSPSITAAIMAHMSAPPPKVTDARPDLPPMFDYVVERAMAKDKGDRFQSCSDLIGAAKEGLRILQEWGPAPTSGTVVAGGGFGPSPGGTEVASSPRRWQGNGGGTVAATPAPADTRVSDGDVAAAGAGPSAEAQQQPSGSRDFPGQGGQQQGSMGGQQGAVGGQQGPVGGPPQWGPSPGPYPARGAASGGSQDRRKLMIMISSGVGLVVAILAAFLLLSGGEPDPPEPDPDPQPPVEGLTSLFEPKSQTTFTSDLSTLLPAAVGPFQFQSDLPVTCEVDPAAASAGKTYVAGNRTLDLFVCGFASPDQATAEMTRSLDFNAGQGVTPVLDPPSTPVLDDSGNQVGEAFYLENENGATPTIAWTNGTLHGQLICRPNCDLDNLYNELEF